MMSFALPLLGKPALEPAKAGLLAWYDASDPAPFEMEGDQATLWRDKSGGGFDLGKKEGTRGPSVVQEQNNRSVRGDQAGRLQSQAVNRTSDEMTVYAVVKAPPGLSPIISFSSTGSPDACVAGWTVGAAPSFLSPNGAAGAYAEVEDGQWHMLTFWRKGEERRFYVDGVLAGEAKASAKPTKIGELLLFEYPGAATFSGELSELLIYVGAQSKDEIARAHEYLAEKWKEQLPDPKGELVVFVGNSITTGMYCGNGQTWSCKTGQAIPGLTHWYNISKGGVNTNQLTAMAGTMIDPLLKGKTGRSTLVFWEGTNDLVVNNSMPRDAAENIAKFCRERKKAGWKNVIVLNVIPRQAGEVFEARRTELNALLVANPKKNGIDAVVNLASLPEIGPAGQEMNTEYFADGTHLTPKGQAVVAGAVVPVLEAIRK